MSSPVVVIASHDAHDAASLAESLRPHCRAVLITRTAEELATAIARNRAQAAIADLESVPLTEIERLHQNFQQLNIVCTHRVPDEQMWADSLAAGAADCCYNGDHNEIVRAALGRKYRIQSNAA
jgi:hypothetical protein